MNFHQFASVVNKQFNQMAKEHDLLYKVNISGDNLWDLYLDAFPEGTNKIYRERREYDCNTCRNFIRNIGNVVAIKDDEDAIIIETGSDRVKMKFKKWCISTVDTVKEAPAKEKSSEKEEKTEKKGLFGKKKKDEEDK